MFVNTNLNALNTARMLNRSQGSIGTALQRLSSGIRVNSAKDDAAGLAIGERMTSSIRGLNASVRNMNDGLSMLQTAEGGLAEVGNMLQRMRELAVYGANTGVLSSSDRTNIQKEITQLLQYINDISDNTNFNGLSVLGDRASYSGVASDDKTALLDGLKRTWLDQSEAMISSYLGLTADTANMRVVFDDTYDGAGGLAAYVQGTSVGDGTGQLENLELHFDMADMTGVSVPDTSGQHDRLIAHEMVHAVMNRTVNMDSMTSWFKEGVAQLLPGADALLNAYSGVVATTDVTTWDSSLEHYATGYAMVRYMHDELINTHGQAAGIKDFMIDLAATDDTFSDSLNRVTGGAWTSEADVRTAFAANGAAFVAGLTLSGDTDTGAIGGADADGGGRDTTSVGVIPDTDASNNNPTSLNIIFESVSGSGNLSTKSVAIQVGIDPGDTVDISYGAASTEALGISSLDLVSNAAQAIVKLDSALDYINLQRSILGAQQNRLQSSIIVSNVAVENVSASRSRIMDADFADESANLTRSQIIQQAGIAMMAQAHVSSNLALDLLSQST